MKDNKKEIEPDEKKIFDEFREEMRSYKKQGKLYLFEDVMDNAIDKFKQQLKELAEEEIEPSPEEKSKKKTVPYVKDSQE